MFSAFRKLKDSLIKTRDAIVGKIAGVVGARKIDTQTLAQMERILLEADIGVTATKRLLNAVKDRVARDGELETDAIMKTLGDEITAILHARRSGSLWGSPERPLVLLIVGVNGAGKTTSVGKLAHLAAGQGKSVMIAACDTFRAAAVEQLEVWAKRSKVGFMRAQAGADPAAVAFDATVSAKAKNIDLLLVDTAGRLHTKSNLMQELSKIRKVISKAAPNAPVKTILVIDGVTGQNALSQVKVFTEAAGCDGIIVTKLDSTAKGGVIVAIAAELDAPVRYIGIGEKIDDLQDFDPSTFAQAILGVENATV